MIDLAEFGLKKIFTIQKEIIENITNNCTYKNNDINLDVYPNSIEIIKDKYSVYFTHLLFTREAWRKALGYFQLYPNLIKDFWNMLYYMNKHLWDLKYEFGYDMF